jgi:hypothetical protein
MRRENEEKEEKMLGTRDLRGKKSEGSEKWRAKEVENLEDKRRGRVEKRGQ